MKTRSVIFKIGPKSELVHCKLKMNPIFKIINLVFMLCSINQRAFFYLPCIYTKLIMSLSQICLLEALLHCSTYCMSVLGACSVVRIYCFTQKQNSVPIYYYSFRPAVSGLRLGCL